MIIRSVTYVPSSDLRLDWSVWCQWGGNSCCLNKPRLPLWYRWFGFASRLLLWRKRQKPHIHTHKHTHVHKHLLSHLVRVKTVCIILHMPSSRDLNPGWGEWSKISFSENILRWALMVFHLATGGRKSFFVKGLPLFTDSLQFTGSFWWQWGFTAQTL